MFGMLNELHQSYTLGFIENFILTVLLQQHKRIQCRKIQCIHYTYFYFQFIVENNEKYFG
jgi:hypothetical protein